MAKGNQRMLSLGGGKDLFEGGPPVAGLGLSNYSGRGSGDCFHLCEGYAEFLGVAWGFYVVQYILAAYLIPDSVYPYLCIALPLSSPPAP